MGKSDTETFASGNNCFRLIKHSTMTEILTNANDVNAPKLTNLTAISRLITRASNEMIDTKMMLLTGVRNFG